MQVYQLNEFILLFFIYACLGWGCEVAFAACKEGKFINRGFLNGPICPIYGFGVLTVVLALAPIRDNAPLLFVCSVALTTAMEFITGLVLEKLFHARWWDYSDTPLSFMGYVSLVFSLVWGAGCLAVVEWIHPLILSGVRLLPRAARVALDSVFGTVFAVDVCATVSAVRRLSERLRRLTELGEELRALSDEIGQTIYDTTVAAKGRVVSGGEVITEKRAKLLGQFEQRERQISDWLDAQRAQGGERFNSVRARFDRVRASLSAALEERGFSHRRILNAFPTLRSERYQEAVEVLRASYRRLRRK